jgi:WD40 repeat protein
VDIRPEGDTFVTADTNGRVLLWTKGSHWAGKTLLAGDGVPVFEARFHPNGRSLITCSENGSATLFALPSGKGRRIDLPSQNKWLEICEFSPDGKWLLVTSETGQAWLMDSEGRHPQVLRREAQLAHVGSIVGVSFSRDSSQVLLVGGVDAEATLWDVRTRKLLSVLSGHRGAITTGSIKADRSELMTASEDGSVRLWRNGWQDLRRCLRSMTTATLNPEQRMVLLGETETDAWREYGTAERLYGRTAAPAGQFLFPY